MTNEQLKILLEYSASLLEKAIETSVELMPEGAEKEFRRYHNFELETYKALFPIYEHLELLREQIENLVPDKLFYLGGDKPGIIE